MKTPSHYGSLLVCALASAVLAGPALAVAQTTQPTTPATAQPDSRAVSANVSGKVEAKSDTTLTVRGHTISFNSATTFSRSGASIGSGDVKVGDKVNIVTAQGGQVAIAVEVLSSD